MKILYKKKTGGTDIKTIHVISFNFDSSPATASGIDSEGGHFRIDAARVLTIEDIASIPQKTLDSEGSDIEAGDRVKIGMDLYGPGGDRNTPDVKAGETFTIERIGPNDNLYLKELSANLNPVPADQVTKTKSGGK